MSNVDSIVTRGFDVGEARKLIPEGRVPYVEVRETLGKVTLAELGQGYKQQTTGYVSHAIRKLNDSLDILEPPLTNELRDAVKSLAELVDPEEGLPYEGFNPFAARWVLEAVFEHGYRADS